MRGFEIMFEDEEKKVTFHVKQLGQDSTYAITGYVLEGYEDESDMFYFFNYHTEEQPDRSIVMARAKYKLVEVEDSKFGFANKKKGFKIIKEIVPLPQSLSLVRQKEIDRRKLEEPYRDEVDKEFVASILPSVIKLLTRQEVNYNFKDIYKVIQAKIAGEGRTETT